MPLTLTVLARVFTAKNWQALANCCPHHERVCCAQSVLVRLSQGEVLKVETQLANIVCLFDCHLARVGSVFTLRVLRVDKSGLVLVRGSAASELIFFC